MVPIAFGWRIWLFVNQDPAWCKKLQNPASALLTKLLLGGGGEHVHDHGESTQELKPWKTRKVKTKTET